MDRFEAARVLGLADADVLGVEDTAHGTAVTVRDGGDRLIAEDGVFALTGHPSTAQLRRHEPAVADDVADDVDQDGDGVPDGSADGVLKWVGEDPERAARALEAEQERDSPRAVLSDKLRKLTASA